MGLGFLTDSTITGTLTVSGTTTLSTIAEVGSDTDKFLMSDGGAVKYVTGANLRSYIGAGTGSGTVTSVAVSAGTGISISGSPITSSGTITVTNSAPYTSWEIQSDSGGGAAADVTDGDTVTFTSGDSTLDVTNSGTSISFNLADTAVSAGSYTLASITVDAQGRITSASSGSSGSGTVTSVSSTTTNQLTVASSTTTPALTIVTGAVTNGGTALATGDQIYDATTTRLGSYLPLAGGTMTGNVVFNDNVEINLGTGGGSDSKIYSDGTDINFRSYVNDGDISFRATNTTNGLKEYFALDGGVELTRFYQGVNFNDDVKLTFGDVAVPGDLEIWHDEDNSYITDTGTGSLKVGAANWHLMNAAHTEYMLTGTPDGPIIAYYDNSQRLSTTAAGITVTGIVTATGGTSTEWNEAYDNMITGFSDSGTSTVTLTLTQQDGGTLTTSFSVPQGTGDGTVTSVATGTGLTGGTITTSGTLSLANTAVSAGSYTNASITVDAQGRLTSASSGSDAEGVTSVATGAGLSGGTITSTGTLILDVESSTTSTTSTDADWFSIANTAGTTYKMAPGDIDLSTMNNDSGWTTNTGTVTNVAISAGTGISVSGSPITGSGTITITNTAPSTTSGTVTSVATGAGLSGGTITSTGTLILDVEGSTTTTTSSNADWFSIANTAGTTYKIAPGDIDLSTMNNDSGWTTNTGTVTSVATGTGLSGGTITTSGTVSLANTAVTAGSYTHTSLTVDAQGRITAASSGSDSAGVTSITFTSDSGSTSAITSTGTIDIAGGTNVTTSATGSTVTINSTDQYTGTVTSVATTAPITGGTITGSGTIAISNATGTTVGAAAIDAGTGISVSDSSGVYTITNSSPSSGGTVTSVATGGGLTGGTITTSGTLSHADTSSQASVDNSGRTFIQDITLDTYGHVTAIGSATDSDTYDGTVTSVATSGTVNGLTLTGGTITTSGTITLGGTLAINNGDWSGTDLSVANGGTGASTASGARSNLGAGTGDGTVTSVTVGAGNYLNGGGTITTSGTATVNHDTTSRSDTTSSTSPGSAGTFTAVDSVTTGSYGHITALNLKTVTMPTSTNNSGTVTSVAGSAGTGISISGSPITSSGTLTITNTGVTSIVAGSNISISGATGAVTISADTQGDLTAVEASTNDSYLGITVASGTGPVPEIGINISGLTNLSATPEDEDELIIYDEGAPKNKSITVSNLMSYITDGVTMAGDIVLADDGGIQLDTSLSSGASGTIIKLHSKTTVAGRCYNLLSSGGGTWDDADATDVNYSSGMLAIAVGTAATSDGMLINGVFYSSAHGFDIGQPLYLSVDSPGALSNDVPSGGDEVARIVGYAIDTDEIYFCPDNTWVLVS